MEGSVGIRTNAEGQWLAGVDNVVHTDLNVCVENLYFFKLLVPMCGEPDAAQGAFLGEDDIGVEHESIGGGIRGRSNQTGIQPKIERFSNCRIILLGY